MYADCEWLPCDEEPILFVQGFGKKKIFCRHRIVSDAEVYNKRRHFGEEPRMGRIPHYYTCSKLRAERRAWAIAHRED